MISRSGAKEKADEPQTASLTTSQLMEVAELVVRHSFRVPNGIIKTIQAVIHARQICADWYQSLTLSSDTTTQQVDRGHQHFIDVLKSIEQLLQNSVARKKDVTTSKHRLQRTSKITAKPPETSTNTFSCLQFDEPVEETSNTSRRPPLSHEYIHFELRCPEQEEAIFAIWCFLQDMHDVRLEVRKIWMEFKEGKVSLTAAAMTIAVAVHLAQKGEIAVRKFDLTEYTDLVNALQLEIGRRGNEVWVVSYKGASSEEEKDKGKDTTVDITDLICPRAYLVLKGLTKAVWLTDAEESTMSMCGCLALLNLHPFGKAAKSALLDLALMAKETRRVPVGDDFLFELVLLASGRSLAFPTWMVMTCQIIMDIHEIVEPYSDVWMEEFEGRLTTNLASIRRAYLKARERGWPKSIVKRLVDKEQDIEEHLRDFCHELQTASHCVDQRRLETHPQYRVYRLVPYLPGLVIYRSSMYVSSIGLSIGSVEFNVLCTTYIYRATQLAGLPIETWPDLEFVEKGQSKKKTFVLVPSSGIGAMAKCFAITFGCKASAFAGGRRPTLPPVRQAIQTVRDLEYKRYRKLTPTGLFLAFKHIYIADEADLMFDYIRFSLACMCHMECVQLLWLTAKQLSTPDGLTGCTRAYEMVYELLWNVADKSASGTYHGKILSAMMLLFQDIGAHEDHNLIRFAQHQKNADLQLQLSTLRLRTRAERHREDVVGVCKALGVDLSTKHEDLDDADCNQILMKACPFPLDRRADLTTLLRVLADGKAVNAGKWKTLKESWKDMAGSDKSLLLERIDRVRKYLTDNRVEKQA